MKIIREGIAEMRHLPPRLPVALGFSCPKCECVFEAAYEEATKTSLYANFGRIVDTVYTCLCPNCNQRLQAESYKYEKQE